MITRNSNEADTDKRSFSVPLKKTDRRKRIEKRDDQSRNRKRVNVAFETASKRELKGTGSSARRLVALDVALDDERRFLPLESAGQTDVSPPAANRSTPEPSTVPLSPSFPSSQPPYVPLSLTTSIPTHSLHPPRVPSFLPFHRFPLPCLTFPFDQAEFLECVPLLPILATRGIIRDANFLASPS